MNKEIIIKRIEDLQKHIDFNDILKEKAKELIKELEDELESKNIFPQMDDEYWYIDSEVGVEDSVYYNDEIDRYRLSYGNFYRTKKEAQEELDKLKSLNN